MGPATSRIIKATAGLIVRHPRLLVAFSLVLLVVGFLGLPRLSTRNTDDDFTVRNDPRVLLHDQFIKVFPKNQYFVIAYQRNDLFTPGPLEDLRAMTLALKDLEVVEDVVSLANAEDTLGTEDAFVVEEFLSTIPQDPAGLTELRRRALEDPLFAKQLISTDGRTAAILVFTDPDRNDDAYRNDLMRQVDQILAPYRSKGYLFHLAGWPVTDHFVSEYMYQDVARIIPLTFVLVLVTVGFHFRNLRLVGLASLGIGGTLATTLGLAGWANITLNNTAVAVIPLVMALALSDLVHLFSHLDFAYVVDSKDRRGSLARVLEQILFPCFVTSLNTAIGFASLSLNRVPAIQTFGILAAAGMFFEFIISFGLVAPLLLAFPVKRIYRKTETHRTRLVPRMIRAIHKRVMTYPALVLTFAAVLLAGALWQSTRLRVETNMLDYFRPESPVRQGADFVKENLAGVESLDVFFQSTRDAFREPSQLRVIEEVEQFVLSLPEVDAGTSLVGLFKGMNQSFHGEDPSHYRLPETRRLVDQYLLLYDSDDLEDFVTPGFDQARLALRVNGSSSARSAALVKRIEEFIQKNPWPGIQIHVTGFTIKEVATVGAMVEDQIQNVLSAIGAIWTVMLVLLRSLPMAGLFLVPNIFPIVINFGIMGAFGISINVGTALIAASAFGIIVDDTVHFFLRLQERRRNGLPLAQALQEVTEEKGEATLVSFSVLVIGFGVLMVSRFQPIFHFGLLNVIVLLTGAMGDMLVLKALFALYLRRQKPSPVTPIGPMASQRAE